MIHIIQVRFPFTSQTLDDKSLTVLLQYILLTVSSYIFAPFVSLSAVCCIHSVLIFLVHRSHLLYFVIKMFNTGDQNTKSCPQLPLSIVTSINCWN